MMDDEKKAELDQHLSELHAELRELALTDAHRAKTVVGSLASVVSNVGL